MKYGRMSPPIVTKETPAIISLEDKWDEVFHLYPSDGIIQDHIYHTLGWETTNLYAFWAAIAGLSSLAGRQVYLRAGQQLYPNFYVILVGLAGLSHKSTGMILWENMEDEMWHYLPEHMVEIKKVPIIKSKATPEFLFTQMQNRELSASPGSYTDAVLKLRVSELDNFLSKATYNATLISKLTDFYDCRKFDTDGVLGRNNGKLVEIRNIYATLFGCTTPTALKNTLPEEAFGGGFMSRATIVNQDIDDFSRSCSMPYFLDDAPDVNEMAQRLAWIVLHKNGEYTLTPEAFRFYDRWYAKVREEIIAKASQGDSDHRDNRLTLQTLKLATLISYQRYDLERRVTLHDLVLAVNIMDFTLQKSTDVLDKVTEELSIDAKLLRFYRVLKIYGIEGTTRRNLARKHNYKVDDIEKYMKEMTARGLGIVRRVLKTAGNKEEGTRNVYEYRYAILDETEGDQIYVTKE